MDEASILTDILTELQETRQVVYCAALFVVFGLAALFARMR